METLDILLNQLKNVHLCEVGSMSSHGALVELFGTCNGETSIDRGWLTTETVIQLKFVADPIRVWKKTLRDKTVGHPTHSHLFLLPQSMGDGHPRCS